MVLGRWRLREVGEGRERGDQDSEADPGSGGGEEGCLRLSVHTGPHQRRESLLLVSLSHTRVCVWKIIHMSAVFVNYQLKGTNFVVLETPASFIKNLGLLLLRNFILTFN